MGSWRLERLRCMGKPLDQPSRFGTNFHMYYELRYTPSRFGRFKETPRLDWHEQILMKEHHNNQWWEFETNMYTHNPLSKTLEIWAQRYFAAYQEAAGWGAPGKGSSQLFDDRGMRVKIDELGKGLTDCKQQADAVRSFLKSYGGILKIEIHDIPCINKPDADTHKERLLLFNCGVEGDPRKIKAEQYLDVDGAKPWTQWQRRFHAGWVSTWKLGGFKKVPPPEMVSKPRMPLFVAGECW